ncbi:hypothetical protein P280DRAFT_447772 [Massarina eburnea CBS 473.64]|uniref:Cupin 2 conserved barrel domain-containing protein n=1 Tax=Massarina eburnea CBS 473.64 TaxID=1395130 RepID=A0A6A6S497_9PLEO|nr:hypothetical protein P280DRAFT_447772 [Massarina eburnea CBS 473.64]
MSDLLTNPVPNLPPNKRYIATHDGSGKSIIHSSPPQLYTPMGPNGLARSYATPTMPAHLTNNVDVTSYLSSSSSSPTTHTTPTIVTPTPSGSNLLIVDLAPGGMSHMHRTVTLDYSICVIGRIKMEMDGGAFVELGPGDHVIQRGTMHKWYNASQTEPARLIGVILPCEPFEIPGTGKLLTEEHLST